MRHSLTQGMRSRLVEASAVFDRALGLDRDSRLHGQREKLAVVGSEGRRRPRGARALVVDAIAARLRQLAEEAHRLGREAAPDLALSLSLMQ